MADQDEQRIERLSRNIPLLATQLAAGKNEAEIKEALLYIFGLGHRPPERSLKLLRQAFDALPQDTKAAIEESEKDLGVNFSARIRSGGNV